MPLEKLDTEVRRAQILQAALGLIANEGLRRLSIGAVARRVGIVPSGIYRHFRSKDEIVDAALEYVARRARQYLLRICEQVPNALDRLERLLMLHVKMVRELQALPRIMFSEEMYGESSRRKKERYQLEEIVRQGQQAGQIRRDLDAGTVAVMLWGLLPPAVILWHVSDGRFDVTKHMQRVWQIVRRALQQDQHRQGGK